MDTALVTGAERGVGLQIARKLIDMGLRVYGLAQDFSKCPFEHPEFFPVPCDLTARDQLEAAWEQISSRDPVVHVLVNAARREPSGPLEATPLEEVEYCLQTSLLCPVTLTRLALPTLIRFRGYVINVAWHGQGLAPGGATGAAAHGGLRHFAEALFDEVRDTGVKVTTLYPQANAGELDPKARISMEPQSAVEPALFAQAVAMVLGFKENNCVSQIVVRPQGTREEPKIPGTVAPLERAAHAIRLPEPRNFPVEPEPIPTPPRERPADAPPPGEDDWDDEDEDEDDELDRLMAESRRLLDKQKQEARRQLDRTRERKERPPNEGSPHRSDEGNEQSGESSGEGGKKRRRRRRRGGRGRRDKAEADAQGQASGEHSAGENAPREEAPRADSTTASDGQREPLPVPESASAPPPVSPSVPESAGDGASVPEAPPVKKAVKKATRKTAKKATKKAAAKKTTTKKAAKKAAKKKSAVKKGAVPETGADVVE